MSATEQETVGDRIRRAREEAGLSLSQLAERSGVSKGYLSTLENEEAKRPSGETLYAIAEAVGVTMSALLGRRMLADPATDIPDSLQQFAHKRGLSEKETRMLAGIEFRGVRPQTPERWEYIFNAIHTSQALDDA